MEISPGFSPVSEVGHEIQQMAMPILARAGEQFSIIGTGFMITQNGLMVTAAHVIKGLKREGGRTFIGGQFYDNVQLYALYIESEKYNNEKNKTEAVSFLIPCDGASCYINENIEPDFEPDFAFLYLRKPSYPLTFRLATLSFGLPKDGDKVHAFGYHNAKVEIEIINSTGLPHVKLWFDSAFSEGEIIKVYPEKHPLKLLKFPCFETTARIKHTMSGGLILNKEQAACGISVYQFGGDDEAVQPYKSVGALLYPMISTKLEKLGSYKDEELYIYDLIERGEIKVDETYKDLTLEKDNSGRIIGVSVNDTTS